jgi:SAM-dependent methyltransferase
LSGNPSTVSDLWSKFAEDRQAPGSAAWMFAPDHPRLRKRIYDTYLDGLDPFTWVRNRLARLPARHGLEIGCGGGDLAIAIVETGMCERLDAFDVAAGAIDAARAEAAAGALRLRLRQPRPAPHRKPGKPVRAGGGVPDPRRPVLRR